MHSVARPLVIPNLVNVATRPDLKWEPFRPGIDIVRLSPPGTWPASALLRYAPGAKLQRHLHRGWEHILVLSGAQIDENGRHQAGALLIHPPGSTHTVSSETGCVVLAMWEMAVSFLPETQAEPIASIVG